ncbi:MAG: M48 family metallopeptidase [Aestuariibacter sp.]
MDKNQQMEALLSKAEMELAQNPAAYEKKLLRYSLLGYGVILLLVLLLTILMSGTVVLALSSSLFLLLLFKKKLIIPLLIMMWVLFKSVFIRYPKPEGISLSREHSPELFALIDEIRERLDSGPIHQVIVTPELNAAMIQTPRFLAFGFTHNSLVLGFELLLSLTVDELRSVIGHELGHLSGNHSKFHGWIYRSRESWRNMMYNLDQHNGWTTAPIRKFFNWYSPRFSAYSFALARLNEYEADKVAASFGSDQIAASALLKLPVYGQFIQEKHWNKFNEDLLTCPEPSELPYTSLVNFMESNFVTEGEALSAIEFARKTTTNYHDTHPCLTERLNALNSSNIKFKPTTNSAGRELLGSRLEVIAEQLDNNWSEYSLEGWKKEYEIAQKEKRELQSLEEKEKSQLTKAELWDLAWMSEKFGKSDTPLNNYQTYNSLYPNDEKAHFAIGRLLLNDKDESGIKHLEQAMKKDEFIEPAGQLAYGYFVEKGEPEKANNWLSKVYELEEIYRAAQEERTLLHATNIFIKPEKDMQEYESITNIILEHKRVKRAWVAQKKVKHFTDSPVLVFAVKPKSGFYISNNLAETLLKKIPEEHLDNSERPGNYA